jgi:hypothetical protein
MNHAGRGWHLWVSSGVDALRSCQLYTAGVSLCSILCTAGPWATCRLSEYVPASAMVTGVCVCPWLVSLHGASESTALWTT